jgi:acyl carrier protein
LKNQIEKFLLAELRFLSADDVWTIKRGQAPWDSLKHIELINAFERHFSVHINFHVAAKISSASDFLELMLPNDGKDSHGTKNDGTKNDTTFSKSRKSRNN